MIHFVLHEHHAYAVGNYLETWGRSLRPIARIVSHQSLRHATRLPAGTYVFGDADRLTADERSLGAAVADTLVEAGCRVLNHPARTCWRYELCRRLRAAAINDYRVFRASDDWSHVRPPAFVRFEDDHASRSRALLPDVASVRRAIDAVPPDRSGDLLVVERLDVRGVDGLCRKYSALRIGDRVLPRHVLFSNDWVVKYPDLVTPALVAEEDRFLDDFGRDVSHRAQVERVFAIADVEYGRLDYSVVDGRVQAWEINLSPHLAAAPDRVAPARLASQAAVTRAMNEAIAALDVTDDRSIRLRHDVRLLARLGVGRGDRALRVIGKVAARASRWRCFRRTAALWRRAAWLASQ